MQLHINVFEHFQRSHILYIYYHPFIIHNNSLLTLEKHKTDRNHRQLLCRDSKKDAAIFLQKIQFKL